MIWLLLLVQLWTTIPDPRAILQGNWQSCREEDGAYAERVYEHRKLVMLKDRSVMWIIDWEFHMGPYHEFALYNSLPTEHDHFTPLNLLGSQPVVETEYGRGRRQWRVCVENCNRSRVNQVNLWVSIILAGGSRNDCESFLIRIERVP